MAAPSPSLGGVPSRLRDWRRAGEPGSTFIGLSKPPRGRGRGRGISASHQRAPGDSLTNPGLPEKVDSSAKSKAPTPHTASKSTGPVNAKPSTSPRRASRVAPILVVDSSSLSEPSPSNPPESARPPNRRRRSQAHGKHPNTAAAKLDVPAPSFTRQQRSRSGPESPSTKDTKEKPPQQSHSDSSTPSSTIRTDIDALVEHVRAIATHQRPITPGSHIDWAGDEDDTLPNLDDWGIDTRTNSKEPSEGMSPLSVGGLTSLPEPITQSATPSLETGTETAPINNHVAKPTVPSERTDTFPRRRDGKNITDSQQSYITPADQQVEQPSVEPVSEASHISTTDASVQPELSIAVTDVISEQGLTASIHAPKPSSESSPTDAYPRPITSAPPRSRPTHARNQTVGRIYPHSAPGHGYSHSDPSHRGHVATRSHHHARTQSTPVTTSHRASHARPVITGEAISRLARTIIGSSKQASRVAANTTPKD
jgi:hypothetical protein